MCCVQGQALGIMVTMGWQPAALPQRMTAAGAGRNHCQLLPWSGTPSSSPARHSLLPSPAPPSLINQVNINIILTRDISPLCELFLCSILSLVCANCNGVRPLLSRVVRSVPAFSRSVTTGTWLVQAARCMAVLPNLSFWFGSAPCLSRTSTTSEYP